MTGIAPTELTQNKLWEIAELKELIPLSDLDEATRECLLKGDGVYDHYGSRSSFLVIEAKGSRLLILELAHPGSYVRPINAINATGGYGTGILGGNVSDLASTLVHAIQTAACTNDEHYSLERSSLVKTLLHLAADHTETDASSWNITFTSTGTEAMDFALQLVLLEGYSLTNGKDYRQDKNVLVACRGAWHGWGISSNQLLDRRQFTEGLPRLVGSNVVFVSYGDLSSLETVFSQYRGAIRGFFVEGLLGDGGVVPASQHWWERLLELAEKEDARVVVDEILTGFRCGGLLALPHGIAPDCITLGKALGLGMFPLSAVLWRRNSMNPRPGVGVRTFNARPFQAKVIKAGLDRIVTGQLFEYSAELGQQLKQSLTELLVKFPNVYKAVRGQGLLIGVELANPLARKGRLVRDVLIREGVLVEIESGQMGRQIPRSEKINQTIRLTPPLTLPQEEVPQIVECFKRAAETLMQMVEQ